MVSNYKYRIVAKSVLLILTCLILCYLLKSHLVATHQDTAIIWAYKPHTVLDFSIYCCVCLAAITLSSLLLPVNKKVLTFEVVAYFIVALSLCFLGDSILASIHFDWPMSYTPNPV